MGFVRCLQFHIWTIESEKEPSKDAWRKFQEQILSKLFYHNANNFLLEKKTLQIIHKMKFQFSI